MWKFKYSRAQEIAEEFMDCANPERWNGFGEQPESFRPSRIFAFPIAEPDEFHPNRVFLEIVYEENSCEDEMDWLCHMDIVENGQSIAHISDDWIGETRDIADDILRLVHKI